jgi:sulfite reductase (ferredoxin)
MLLSKDMKCNTQKGIIDDFQTYYIQTGDFGWSLDFSDYVLRINQQEPSQAFATLYCEDAHQFIQKVIDIRKIQLLETNGMDKEVIADYYKA